MQMPKYERLSSQLPTGRAKLVIVDSWFRKSKVEILIEVENTFEITKMGHPDIVSEPTYRTERFFRSPTPTEAIYTTLKLIDHKVT